VTGTQLLSASTVTKLALTSFAAPESRLPLLSFGIQLRTPFEVQAERPPSKPPF